MKLTKAQADALYRAIIHGGGDLERLHRAPSQRARTTLRAAGLVEWRGNYELHVTEAGYNAALEHAPYGLKRAQLAQAWRSIREQVED